MALSRLQSDLEIELDKANRLVDDLNAKLAAAIADRDDIQGDIDDIAKLAADKVAAAAAAALAAPKPLP